MDQEFLESPTAASVPSLGDTLRETEPESEAVQLDPLLASEARIRRRDTLSALLMAGVLPGSIVALTLLPASDPQAILPRLVFGYLAAIGSVLGIGAIGWRSASRRQAEITHALKRAPKPSIGALLQMLEIENLGLRSSARDALTDTLPALTEAEAAGLSSQEWQGLRRLLARASDRSRHDVREIFCAESTRKQSILCVAILQIMGRFGSSQDLPLVKRIARDRALGPVPATFSLMVRAAAQEALPALQERARAEREGSQLLRGASLAPPAGELLRTGQTPSPETHDLLHIDP